MRRLRPIWTLLALAPLLGCQPDPQAVKACEHQMDLFFEGPGKDAQREAKIETCVKSAKQMRDEFGEERYQEVMGCLLAAKTKEEYQACSSEEEQAKAVEAIQKE